MAVQLKDSQGKPIYPTIDKKYILDLIYPVGSIFQSTVDKNPGDTLGGTWESIKGKFLLAEGPGHSVGSEGGEENHKLTIPELPHMYADLIFPSNGLQYSLVGEGTNMGNLGTSDQNCNDYFKPTTGYGDSKGGPIALYFRWGSDQPHNNMPPYITIYMWKRTA